MFFKAINEVDTNVLQKIKLQKIIIVIIIC